MLPFFSIEQSNQHSSCRNEAGELLNDGTIRLWTRNNITAINFIFASITKKMKENLYTPGLNAAQIWAKLNLQYQLQTEEQLHLLWQQYYDFKHTAGTFLLHHPPFFSFTYQSLSL
jgi:hypothetical protein